MKAVFEGACCILKGGGTVRRWARTILTAAAALALMCATGCGARIGFTLNPQDLYGLPKLPAKYTELNNRINAILGNGAEYAAPVSGANIQPVQLADLDGDGREEAVAFFRNSADERPLKIYIFNAQEDTYDQAAVIEGSGTAIYSVAYSDMDGDGRTELAVGWRVNADLLALTVYALRPEGPEELVRTDYVRYAIVDMDRNDLQELVVFRANEEGEAIADYYGWQDGGLAVKSSARISITMAELSQQGRVSPGTLEDGLPALFVTGVTEVPRAITDILTLRNGELANVVVSDTTGVSAEIAPFCSLYPTDINADGVTEVPRPEPLPNWYEGDQPYQRIDWRGYDSQGEASLVQSTYHNMEDGWYLRLRDEWRDQILVSRNLSQDEVSVTFFIAGSRGQPPEPFLRITAITGANRESRAVRGGRFNLSRQQETFYAAELLEANETWAYGVTEDQVREAFSLIAAEWSVGEN